MGIKTPEERARAKHNELVALLARLHTKRDKTITALGRVDAKLQATVRAIVRSSKRIDKLVAAATHNNGPTATPVPQVIAAPKSNGTPPLDDGIPDILRRKPEVHPKGEGVKPRAAKARRTPDDFAAEQKAKRKNPPGMTGGLA